MNDDWGPDPGHVVDILQVVCAINVFLVILLGPVGGALAFTFIVALAYASRNKE